VVLAIAPMQHGPTRLVWIVQLKRLLNIAFRREGLSVVQSVFSYEPCIAE
jgi:hypothetical protein